MKGNFHLSDIVYFIADGKTAVDQFSPGKFWRIKFKLEQQILYFQQFFDSQVDFGDDPVWYG